MDTRDITEELVALIEQNGVEIRREAMNGGGGGLCVIREKKIFFVDTDCSIVEMNAICSRTVNELMDIDTVYIRPQVRQLLEKYVVNGNKQ